MHFLILVDGAGNLPDPSDPPGMFPHTILSSGKAVLAIRGFNTTPRTRGIPHIIFNPPDIRCTSYPTFNHHMIHVYIVYIKLNRVHMELLQLRVQDGVGLGEG